MSNFKSILPQMSARFGLAGKSHSGNISCNFRHVFSLVDKNTIQKIHFFLAFFLGGPMGPIHPVWALAAIHLGWVNSIAESDDYNWMQKPNVHMSALINNTY